MSKETFDSLGHQKRVNYALLAPNKEQFIREVTDGLTPPPYYFPKNVELNKYGYESFEAVLERGAKALTPDALELLVESTGALLLDTRKPEEFCAGFVPRSIFIGVDGDFAPWVGTLITDIKQPLVLVCAPGREEEVVTRLARVGYENVLGYLEGGVEAWKAAGKEVDTVRSVTAEAFAESIAQEPKYLFDVRRPSEYESEHLLAAHHVSLAQLNDQMAEFHREADNYIHCAGGYRSVIASSILKARGYHNVVNILGGFKALAQTNLPRTDYACTKSTS
jgi:rhodanese-related sulfurtransferase